jgi:hypothetical protein
MKLRFQKLNVMIPTELFTKLVETNAIKNVDAIVSTLLEEYFENMED